MAKRATATDGGPRPLKRAFVDLTADDIIPGEKMGFVPNTLSTDPLVPKRPTSQAAAMASEPSPDSIDTVSNFTGCTTAVAIRALKVKNNDVFTAVNAILENEDLEKLENDLGWNESLMNSVQPFGNSAAPTRGNSPARSMQPSNQDEADEQMAAAMAASQQETGVVNADGTSSSRMIGPMVNHYSSNEWAMVKYGAQELLADLEIAQRVQDKNAPEPRLLKHLPDGDYTPNLLTICHAIPAAREALLMKEFIKTDYGHDDGWWRGQSIPTPTVVHMLDGSPVDPLADKHEELIAEVQRLMAFLGSSDRIYASIGGLTESKMIKNHDLSGGSLLEIFLKSWKTAAESYNAAASGIFTMKMGTNAEAGMDTPDLSIAEISVQSKDGVRQDLSELLDDLVWDQDLEDDNYIEKPADVFVLTLKQTSSDTKRVGVDVPASLYIDKYLQENIASSREVRKEMVQARYKLAKIEAIERKLTTWSYFDKNAAGTQKEKLERERKEKLDKEKGQIGPQEKTSALEEAHSDEDNAQVGVTDILAHSLAHFSGENCNDADGGEVPASPNPPEFADIAAKLERVMLSIQDKLSELSVNKEKTRNLLSTLSKSSPPHANGEGLKHRYTLRGAATKPNITYVLSPKSNDDVEMTGQDASNQVDLSDTTPAGMQWWRLDYESNGTSPSIIRTKTADYDVLRAIELEHDSALLVYASDRAVAEATDPASDLPEPLQQFIARDNHQFKLDLAAAKRDPPEYFNVRDSIERRDSCGSTGANAGYSPPPDNSGSPVAEIHLSPERDVEMTEKEGGAKPLTLANASPTMDGASDDQDMGVGGAQHVEVADDKMMD